MADRPAFEGGRVAGYVREATIAGAAFVRIDVPGERGNVDTPPKLLALPAPTVVVEHVPRCTTCSHEAGVHATSMHSQFATRPF